VAKILKCSINFSKVSWLVTTALWNAHACHDTGCHVFREQFVTYAWQMARHDANYASPCRPDKLHATKMSRLVARRIARHCGNKIRASVRLALHMQSSPGLEYSVSVKSTWLWYSMLMALKLKSHHCDTVYSRCIQSLQWWWWSYRSGWRLKRITS